MANIKITDLTAYTDPLNTDVLPIVDVTSDTTKKVSIADLLKNASAGTAAAPGIAFDGDNTGIYSPGADQLAISTGGTGRLFVDADGRVRALTTGLGINRTSQNGFDFDVAGLSILRGSTYVGNLQGISGDLTINAPGSQALLFKNGNTERLRITSDGKLGVGTSSPDQLLELAAPRNNAILRITSTSNDSGWSAGDKYGSIEFYSDDPSLAGAVAPGIAASINAINPSGSVGSLSALTFHTSPATGGVPNIERVRIDSSGRLGLGTSSPGARLEIVGETVTNGIAAHIKAGNGSSTVGLIVDGDDEAGDILIKARSNSSATPTDTDTKFIVTGQGNVGIGTASPNADLDIERATGTVELQLQSRDSSDTFISFGDNDDGDIGQIRYAHSDNSLRFRINASEKARITSTGTLMHLGAGNSTTPAVQFNGSAPVNSLVIDSSGRLLVGTSSTSASANTVLQGHSANSVQDGKLYIQRGATSLSNNTRTGQINFADSASNIGAAIESWSDDTWASGDYPGRLVFSTTADGASSPTERMRIDSDGTVLIGVDTKVIAQTTNPFVFFQGQATTTTSGLTIESYGNNVAPRYHFGFTNPNGVVGTISTNGSATAYNTSSDYRLKENVVPLTGAASRLNELQVHRFNFIADPDKTVDGFLAHEAQEIVPESVTGTKDEVDDEGNPVYQGIDQSKLVPLLTAALQEALAKIETLEQRLNDAGIA